MPLAKYVKGASENKRYQIEYANWLDTGETVVSVTFAITPVTTPPLVINQVQNTPSGTGVQYYASGGVDGQTYTAVATLTTSVGSPPQTKTDDIVFVVREPT